MQFRNATYNAFGTIDCEIEHPQFGWIPFTASPDDVEELGRVVFDAAQVDAAPYVPPEPAPEPTPTEALAAERAAMVATPAQIRLTLLQCGKLDEVQAIANSDPAASIIWEYALEFRRTNALIDALGADGFTPEEIDDIFRAAMAVQI